ncbi:hypothetical protein AR457_25145 [Streptomyces agglomeratus]|uniref:DUF308 domain-containing protein n=1 Tax=Streptomyces agglomeratus TaxID=285458 RepID=A0A1E5PCI2_9ACTN|nr:hypothetical protein [Streptomyces agglomeratus]OEJ27249.1 hypothetical protein AS594_25025 [Streptomyces agglomeratus]OEJ38696.1 hypothetical protein BGK70_11510 [Streptomyces agglomeratus]OEJ46919.1 hypothetical protein AR457_25145 [Streptomyces agglomeratus]OEJ51222.1 hypothetical protein BGK72_10990 [Streptomyces agglomeratus]OEJ58592.1 hypothetical protein BGM19_11900 [Streptomyces agglomeratus]
MAEHDAEPAGREEEREPEETAADTTAAAAAAGAASGAASAAKPVDEDAAWAAIVAGYGEEPPDPPGAKPFKSIEDLALPEGDFNSADGQSTGGERPEKSLKKDAEGTAGQEGADPAGPATETGAAPDGERPLGSSVVFAPGVGGPRNYSLEEPDDEDLDESDEGHFVPPEPPPLPPADTTSRFAWLAVIGGPVLLLAAVLLQWDMTWWLTTLGVGGFLGGFATLVARMAHGDDEDDDPGRGAVV